MKVKVSELQGVALDWAVNQIEECCDDPFTPMFSTNWAQGGPIIEQCCINVYYDGGGYWCATTDSGDPPKFGPTPLIAAMRCYVASRFGDEIEIPEELK